MKYRYVLLLVFTVIQLSKTQNPNLVFSGDGCEQDHLFQTQFKNQIAQLAPDVHRIIDYVVRSENAGETYEDLAYFVDKFGSRLTGTKNLEDAIDFMLNWLKKEGHDNVHGENVTIPIWVCLTVLL